MNNAKIRAIIVVVIALVCLLAAAGLVISQPMVSNVLATRTKVAYLTDTANMVMLQTVQVAQTQTQSAIPTNTNQPTSTLPPTPVPSFTPQPLPNECPAIVTKANSIAYILPGGSISKDGIKLSKNDPITVLGRLKDGGWFYIQSSDNKRWIRSDYVQLTESNCNVVEFSLAYLLGYTSNGYSIIADETFKGNQYFWTLNEQQQSPKITKFGETFLRLEERQGAPKALSSQNVAISPNTPFTLFTNFDRLNLSTDSYVAIRFNSNGLQYYEVRVLPTCELRIYQNDTLLSSQPVQTETNNCGNDGSGNEPNIEDDLSDSLKIQLNNNVITVTVNDAAPVDVVLNTSGGGDSGGKIELVSFRSVVDFYYLVVVSP
jgi:hypothetical protein